MIEIRHAVEADCAAWRRLDAHLSDAGFLQKVRERQAYVLLADGAVLGILRYNLFWDNTPFCTILYVDRAVQRQGYGRALMTRWEQDMKAQGYGMLMTSTRVDETAQHFYRKLGYRDCGGFTVEIPGYEQPMELLMSKGI